MRASQPHLPMSERTLCVAYATTVVGLAFLMVAAYWYGFSIESPSPYLSTREILLWYSFSVSVLLFGLLALLGICGVFLTKFPLYSWIYMAGVVECVASLVMYADVI